MTEHNQWLLTTLQDVLFILIIIFLTPLCRYQSWSTAHCCWTLHLLRELLSLENSCRFTFALRLSSDNYFCLSFFDQTIGEDVHRSKPEKFSELLLKVRQTLVNPPPNLQSDSLATLLLLLESHLLRWPSALPEKTGVIGVDMLNSDPSMPGEWYAQALGSPLQLRKAPTMLSQPQMPRSNGHSPRVREVRT